MRRETRDEMDARRETRDVNEAVTRERSCLVSQVSRQMPPLRFKDFDGEWAEKRLGDFAKVRRGLTYTPMDCVKSGVRVLRSSNIEEDKFALHDDDVFVRKEAADIPTVKTGDILITSANGSSQLVGKHALVEGVADGAAVHGGFMLLATSPESAFLNATMSAPWYRNFVASVMMGGNGALGNLSQELLETMKFVAPHGDKERDRIGLIFRSMDVLIASREMALEKLKALKKAMLEKMFPRAGAKVPEVRFKGFEGEWEKKRLGDICVGFDYGLNVAAREYDGKVKYIRITDIDSDSRLYSKADIVSPDCDGTLADDCKVNVNDILFARTGASVGKTYLYREDDGLVYFAGFLIRAHVGDSYDSEFVFQNTLTRGYEYYVEIVSQRSGQPGMNAVECASFDFLIPSLSEQRKIGAYFRSLDALISARWDEIGKLKDLKKALLERMFV